MIARGARTSLLLLFVVSCASAAHVPVATGQPAAASRAAVRPIVDPDARFWYSASLPLGRAPAESLVNANGSPRILDRRFYDTFWKDHAPALSSWSADPRLRLNPNFVAALMAKESGFDPGATSHVPANGIAQITHIADLDLRIISREAPAWRWMYDEVRRWPRSPLVHDSLARKTRTDSLLRAGTLGPRTEYLFDPRLSTRASLFWLRILAHVWTEDGWPGQYGTMARTRLTGGGPLSESDLLALVTVSYNQGHPYVADLVQRHGRAWTEHLNEESSDYLERISAYTAIFQRAATGR
ncbi:MAG: Transglycosylase domain protein [Gemmatimonadetes bacterium]|jgi:hypothetical protein|nr:Transglycosylase domain protein [Gemmatimonadota bacterium]